MAKMFSSNVIKQEELRRLEVARVNYEQMAAPADGAPTEPEEGGFVRLTFDGEASPPSGLPLNEAPQQEEAAGEQITLTEDMVVVAGAELQQQLEAHYKNGLEEGREQAERGLANVFKALRQSVADLDGLRDKVLRESEEDLLKLAIMIARKVIQQEVAQNPQILANIVAAAITDCGGLDRINIRLNPADYAVVAADRQGFFKNICPDTSVTMAPDETISPGGCIVDTTTGTIDAQIETQLDEIYRRFMEDRSLATESSGGDEVSQNDDKG